MFRRLIRSINILRNNPEETLAYLYGVGLARRSSLPNLGVNPSGPIRGGLIYLRSLLGNTSRSSGLLFKPNDIFFFAGTKNQFMSLSPTMEALDGMGVSYNLCLWGDWRKSHDRCDIKKCFSISDAAISVFLLMIRLFGLRKRVNFQVQGKRLRYFHVYYETYALIPFFFRVLNHCSPRIVVMANDHSTPNRCLLEVARSMGVIVIYMQHASVSDLFPRLKFDYAFLDGVKSMSIYGDIEKQSAEYSEGSHDGQCAILLTGQQKSLYSLDACHSVGNSPCVHSIGVGVNQLDDIDIVTKLARLISESGLTCWVRTHPAQPLRFIERIRDLTWRFNGINWSDAATEGVADFLLKIDALIAANTSLHLEAALNGTPTFYMDLSDDVTLSDYYGYVRGGVSIKITFEDLHQRKNALRECLATITCDRGKRLKEFSESYGTEFQGREGECVARVIQQLLRGEEIGFPYVRSSAANGFEVVYRLIQ